MFYVIQILFLFVQAKPYLDKAGQKVKEGVKTVTDVAKPYTDKIAETSKPYVESMTRNAKPLFDKAGEHMKSVSGIFQEFLFSTDFSWGEIKDVPFTPDDVPSKLTGYGRDFFQGRPDSQIPFCW